MMTFLLNSFVLHMLFLQPARGNKHLLLSLEHWGGMEKEPKSAAVPIWFRAAKPPVTNGVNGWRTSREGVKTKGEVPRAERCRGCRSRQSRSGKMQKRVTAHERSGQAGLLLLNKVSLHSWKVGCRTTCLGREMGFEHQEQFSGYTAAFPPSAPSPPPRKLGKQSEDLQFPNHSFNSFIE